MRVLVTGGTGKIGNAVARRLVDRGDQVVALVRDMARARETLPPGVELARGDVIDPASLREACDGIDAVFNCMGIPEQWLPDASRFELVNAQGALNVITAARQAGAARAVHTSTYDIFHAPPGGTVRESELADYPKGTVYERSKQRAEELVLGEAGEGIEVVIVNPAGVFGPGPWAGSGLDGAIRDAIRRRLPASPPGGMTLCYVDDVAEGHLAAFERGRSGERYILGFVPPAIPVPAARALAAAGERLAGLIRRPPLLGRGQLTYLLWRARVDNTRAREELGIEFTAWPEGISRTVRWMAETRRI
jgi:dihydroflavonol-4-reductase